MKTKIRLEFDFIEIKRKRKKWNIYFIIATEDPTDPQKTILTIVPNSPIKIRKIDQNRVDFESEGGGETNGMIILERDMPEDNSIRARMWVVQSRENLRKAGSILQEVKEVAGGDDGNPVSDIIKTAIGATTPWIAITKSIIGVGGILGGFLSKSKDKKMGFISMDEGFTPEEIDLGELDRTGRVTSFGEIGWTWVISQA